MKKSTVFAGILAIMAAGGCDTESLVLDGPYANSTASCTDECQNGAEKCVDGQFSLCGHFDEDPCTEWTQPDGCENGCDAEGKRCKTLECQDACNVPEKRCNADNTGYMSCSKDFDGCAKWSGVISCDTGYACVEGECRKKQTGPDDPQCTPQCDTVGMTECSGNSYHTCIDPDGDGCRVWSELIACEPTEICSAGECREAPPSCTPACSKGSKECSGNGYRECIDPNNDGCTVWSDVTACSTNQTCEGGNCIEQQPVCSNACEPSGKKRCNNGGVQTCGDYNSDGCLEWGNDSPCELGCENGQCKSSCVDGICPTVVTDFSQIINGDTSRSHNHISTYTGCTDTNESGPEEYYEFTLKEPGYLFVATTEPSGGDVDVHLLSALNGESCLERNDKMLMHRIDKAGKYYVSVDTYTNSNKAGAYKLKITFIGDSSKCGMTATTEKRVSSCGNLNLPRIGKVVEEAHLVTDWDQAQHGSTSWWPSSKNEGLAAHRAHSAEWTNLNVGAEWCPSGEGGCEYGQGCTGKAVPWKAEAWYINMYWSGSGRPSKGERYLVLNPYNGKAVVSAAGYESGPGDCSMMGGAVYEIHSHLGTSHRSSLTFGHMRDQSLEYGPINCE